MEISGDKSNFYSRIGYSTEGGRGGEEGGRDIQVHSFYMPLEGRRGVMVLKFLVSWNIFEINQIANVLYTVITHIGFTSAEYLDTH